MYLCGKRDRSPFSLPSINYALGFLAADFLAGAFLAAGAFAFAGAFALGAAFGLAGALGATSATGVTGVALTASTLDSTTGAAAGAEPKIFFRNENMFFSFTTI
jgi:hypothetical protein